MFHFQLISSSSIPKILLQSFAALPLINAEIKTSWQIYQLLAARNESTTFPKLQLKRVKKQKEYPKNTKKVLKCMPTIKNNLSNTWHAFQHFFSKKHNSLGKIAVKDM